ncbi:ribonuclease R [Candidatus Parcubacteria bacterium]|nr:ribonuclease R [Candidatus Parcubacteria bacterium]
MSKNKKTQKKHNNHGHGGNNEHNRNKYNNNSKFNAPSIQKIQGEIFITAKGLGFVKNTELVEDVKINKDDLNTALHKDTVEVSLSHKKQGQGIQGKVDKVIQRAKTNFVGTIKRKEEVIYFEPDDKKVYRDIAIIQDRKSERVESNQKVILEMEPWTDPQKNPKGKIIKVLGKKGDHNVEMESIVYEKGFNPLFPENIEKEAQRIKEQAPADFEKEIQKRIAVADAPPSGWDFRNTVTFTIDPFDAKDFDDALSFKDLGNGTYEVGIHIADVTHYVTEGSLIDKEAIKRGTSIYLVDRTIPMLPEVLSNDLCSLNPNEDKLAFSAIFILDENCEVQERWFGETIINSNKRFSYLDAQDVLDKNEGEFYNELRKMDDLALLKRTRRTKNGAITFGSNEVKFKLNKEGFPIDVYEKELLETNELIEDFMLLANREVSEYVDRLNKKTGATNPFIYRIHDVPKQERISELNDYLRKIGYELKIEKNGNVSSQEINYLLDKIQGIDEEDLITKAILKSMAKAIYSTNNIGHYGLAFKHYTHFTSPIRRYPDVMAHRLLKKYLKNEKVPIEDKNKYEQLSASSSRQEVLAVDAERDSIKYKYIEYMSERIGQEFNGIITSIVDWGVYVQDIDTKAEGLVRASSLKGDFFRIDPKNYRISGEKSGKSYTLGDKIKIKLIGTNLDKRTIDFEILG